MKNKWEFVRNLTQLTEYVYRLGVYHAVLACDSHEVEEFINDNADLFTNFRFLRGDNERRELTRPQVNDILVVFCNQIKAAELRDCLKYNADQWTREPVRSICCMYYRDGLVDGLKVEPVKAKKYLEEVGSGLIHSNPFNNRVTNTDMYLDTMKVKMNEVHLLRLERRERETTTVAKGTWASSLGRLSVFVGQTYRTRRIEMEERARIKAKMSYGVLTCVVFFIANLFGFRHN